MDCVDLSKLLHKNTVKSLFPNKNDQFSCPTISYKYSKTIRSSITNYKELFTDSNSNYVCSCENYDSKFIDPQHQHIITGDLSIVKTKQLRDLLAKGLNYRDMCKPDITKSYNTFKSGIDIYINKNESKTQFT